MSASGTKSGARVVMVLLKSRCWCGVVAVEEDVVGRGWRRREEEESEKESEGRRGEALFGGSGMDP